MSQTLSSAPDAAALPARSWLERLWASIAERGRSFAAIPGSGIDPLERAQLLAASLLSERGEASGAAVARELLSVLAALSAQQRVGLFAFLAAGFQPDPERLAEAARDYLATPSPQTAGRLASCAEPPRQEVLRRMNMAAGGTAALVGMRKELLGALQARPELALLDADLRHLFASWFNRGFLELRRIDWQTPAATLEKLITYEAVHEIQGWEDLRRRLAPDRRCFAFFHPALPGEPLIFVEVALVNGLATSLPSLLERKSNEAAQHERTAAADTAIFYSISNCQAGLRGISFGNFLIKQVVEELRAERAGLRQFSTLSPVPGFRRWLDAGLDAGELPELPVQPAERAALFQAAGLPPGPERIADALRAALAIGAWPELAASRAAAGALVTRYCALYLARPAAGGSGMDPVARFHLGNGARLERINWMANMSERGLRESYGIMVNYLYDPSTIEANHERFVRNGPIACSAQVEALLTPMEPSSITKLPRAGRRPRG